MIKSLALASRRATAATLVAAAVVALAGLPDAAQAQAKEQFFPLLVYRTGPYAPNGTPWANGKQDYIKLINARDGGINGVKITYEECETGYATDKGVECYERLKGRGATVFDPQATGITFALTDKVPQDKIPLITLGYGLAASQDGGVFKWNFPLMGSYWTAADIIIQHIGRKEGGLNKLKGKKVALVYHDSPFGKEPIPLLEERSKMHGFDLLKIPVTAPGVEQKSAWLQVRQQRPDYVLLWGWGVMNSTALKEAQATGYPREKMYGVWWSGAEPDVKDVGMGAKGYNALALNGFGQQAKVMQEILKHVHDKGQGTGPRDEVGSVLYTRGVIIQMLTIEAVRRAQERFGKGKVMTGEQVRWGLENLALDEKRLEELGFTGLLRPISTSCQDHMGSTWARIHTWDGTKWVMDDTWYQADEQILKPMVKAAADKYAAEKKLQRRTPQDCQS
ncbi:ABC transporter substrate-binding protein [Caldimonas thermodepolymerans]|uniref:ABC transporter permease n=1 Tax=Caldimonas thermodepolymerans TaxID=215580 RepID=A0A2S5T637_9BURK|nr:ABC transporter substrate-binding protein [Caldimonas thermodepolymerans]PPE70464.1 ABC transporter permease [Caldimonas thermodepolymerans]QPC31131.1 ABC transporter substrate-binding protein [Caldimonas thermodepolymerans]RDH96587.1 amino acid/amide ABC transporter substrate-binding protein (HAAT family) [Caldimonas thermodepolymerans]TCP04814.1 amino acid/amide ABC transporter substrate-binding protein (HAAT family) [Caldimonas thermodepolymerans]UZG43860.1 ABC transporter substrate-bind